MPRPPKRPLPPYEEVFRILDYNPETGVFLRKAKSGLRSTVHGPRKTSHSGRGPRYRTVFVIDRNYAAHRVAWLLHHGKDPGDLEVDHINGNGMDNRICNLRLATHKENHRNLKRASNNTSGVPGVHWDKKRKLWRGQLMLNKVKRTISYFASLEEAADGMNKARVKHFGRFAAQHYVPK